MNRAQARNWLVSIGIVPVIRASSAQQALTAINAVCKGGISVLEITMTVPGANKVIEDVRKSMGSDVLVGAGTILNAEGVRHSLDSGAQFIVSPGFDEATIAFAKSKDVLMVA